MTSKVFVKLPVVPFSQRKKLPPEIVSMPNRNEEIDDLRYQGINNDKVTQLEQNMKFLQEQHKITLAALHQEVEALRQRNRDLQFQLVFSKGGNFIQSTPSSPEDNGNGFVKPKGSPVSDNITPLQVELLEKDLQDLKISLNEAKTQYHHMTDVIEKQKKLLELAVKARAAKTEMSDVSIQVDHPDSDLLARLEDAEAVVRRLRLVNEDQRKEIASAHSAYSYGNGNRGGNSRSRGSHSAYHGRGNPNELGPEDNPHKFPPLQTQSYWHRSSRGSHSFDHSSQEYRNGRHVPERQDLEPPDLDNTVLPQLRNGIGSMKVENTNYQPFYRSRGYHSGGGNFYKDGGNRKHRSQKSQRERRDPESREYNRREYKDTKDQRPKEYSEPAKGSRDCRNTQRQ